MKKDIEWAKEELFEKAWEENRAEYHIHLENVYEVIDQLDEPEVKELEQEMIELENELQELDSYTRDLQAHCKEEIKSLEYKLFIEKLFKEEEEEPKINQFYWFTAKKIPLITDVSYMSKDNNFYGFKQTPNYTFHLHHDLRFITHCSLDELIEAFR